MNDEVKPVDFDLELVNTLGHIGLSETATIVDIGCGYGDTLDMWELTGHKGRLIGIEPNSEQFNGRPFWQPLATDEELEALKKAGNQSKINEYYVLHQGRRGSQFGRIELFEANANFLPLPDGTVDLVTFMFSFYHILEEKQDAALDEAKRVLRQPTPGQGSNGDEEIAGILALATSGDNNKEGIRRNEAKIAAELSKLMETEIEPPDPLNSGFTTEDAENILPTKFKHVSVFKHDEEHTGAKIVIKTKIQKDILFNGYRTLRDQYKHSSGMIPSERMFEIALQKVVGKQIVEAEALGNYVEDQISQALFIASDQPLKRLPAKYLPVGAEK